MRRRIDVDELPDRRVVVEFRYEGRPKTVLWLVLEPREQSVCMQHPGFDADIVVATDPVSMMRVFSGITSLKSAVDDGSVAIDGPTSLTRSFNRWFLWSPFAPAVRDRVKA
jgi:hypothetical protein